jgi:hypothetical protein
VPWGPDGAGARVREVGAPAGADVRARAGPIGAAYDRRLRAMLPLEDAMSPNALLARPLLVLALLLGGLAPLARAQVARSPHGVEVDVPAGYRWREGYKSNPSSTTVIYLESTEEGPFPATILVNHGLATAGAKEEDLFAELRSMARTPEDTATLELPSGRFVRVDFEVKLRAPPRTLRQRYYLTLRGKHHYTFSLANLEPERLPQYLAAFDALVAGARFFEPTPPATATAPAPTTATPPPGPAATAPVTSPAPVAARPTPPAPAPQPPRPAPTPATTTPPPVAPKPAPAGAAPVASPSAPATRPAEGSAGARATSPPALPLAAGSKPAPAGTAPVASPGPAPVAAKPPASGPATPPPRAPQRPPQNLLARAKLLSADSEYDPDIWAAAHLIDGRVDLGWCSAPRAKAPFRFVVELEALARLERFVVDAACPDEPGYEGVAASGLVVEGSTTGPDGGWRPIVEVKVEAGKNDQACPLPAPVEARWLRLTIPGNHGHATLTELMDVRAYGQPVSAGSTPGASPPVAAGPAPGGGPGLTPARSLRLDQARASREKNGPELAESEAFAPGSRVWLNLRPRDLVAGKDGKTWLEVDLVLEDREGRELLRRDKVVDHVAPPPLPPLAPFVALHIDLPAGFPAGRYVALLVARDKVAQTSAAATCEFTVTAP